MDGKFSRCPDPTVQCCKCLKCGAAQNDQTAGSSFNWIAILTTCVREWNDQRRFGSEGHSSFSMTYFRCTGLLKSTFELFVFCSCWGRCCQARPFYRYYTNTIRHYTKYYKKRSKESCDAGYVLLMRSYSAVKAVYVCILNMKWAYFTFSVLSAARLCTKKWKMWFRHPKSNDFQMLWDEMDKTTGQL